MRPAIRCGWWKVWRGSAGSAASPPATARRGRKRRYETESDPLYLEWQYDKTPESEQVWRDKVSEIKSQLPIGVNQ